MAVGVERKSRDALSMSTGLVDIPGIVSGISRYMQGKATEHGHGLDVEGQIVTDIALVERVGELREHHIAVVRRGGRSNTRAIAPQVLFALPGGAIGVVLVGAAFDAHATIGVAMGLTLLAEAILDGLTQVVLAHPGILVFHIEGHDLA